MANGEFVYSLCQGEQGGIFFTLIEASMLIVYIFGDHFKLKMAVISAFDFFIYVLIVWTVLH